MATACLSGNTFCADIVPTSGPYDIPAIAVQAKPKIDGHIELDEYPSEARREGFTDNDTDLASDDPAEFWISYDEKFIYFAARIKTDPRKVIREEYRPNSSLRGNDNIALQIDPFGTNSNFNSFGTNANGATDIQLAGGRAAKTEWIGEIEANGRLTDSGWECEMQIPWSIMSLPNSGLRDLSFNVRWFRTKKQNSYIYRFTNGDSSLTPKWTGAMVPNVPRSRSLSLLPYVFGGYEKSNGILANAGLDFKTSLTDSIQLVGTINPDFRNVESSILALDFSYFERLADENRPFFQEGSRYLRMGFDSRLFASQRIPFFDAGFNVYGELDDKTTFGALTTLDFGKRRASVVKANHRFNDNDSIEFGLVNNDKSGENNIAGLMNYFTRKGELTYFLTNQFTDDQQEGSGWRNNIGAMFNTTGYSGNIEYLAISEGFFPRIGFNRESNLHGFNGSLSKELTPKSGPLNSYNYGFSASTYNRLNGGFYRNNIALNGELNTKSGIGVGTGVGFTNFEGIYDHSFNIGVGFPTYDPYRRIEIDYSDGTFRGDSFQRYGIGLRYRFGGRLQMNANSQFQLSTEDRTQHIVGLNYDLSKYESIGGRLVYQDGESNWYLSYRMSGRLGAEYFLLIGDPRANVFTDRIVLKAVLPFTIRY
ncbi:MAG: DUF5916 domain-containing protein [Fimbriimonadaceae bacterium]